MRYNVHPGKIYDTLYYGQLFFCKQKIRKLFKEAGYNLDRIFPYYEEVRNSCGALPNCLYPFFYVDGKTPTVLNMYMREYHDFHKHTFKSLF